jgi:hypothetical protein
MRSTRTMGRRCIVGAAAVLAAVGLAAVGAGQASASATRVTAIQNGYTGLCLDTNIPGEVFTRKCTKNNSYQKWTVDWSTGRIQNWMTGRCLDSNAESSDFGHVYALPCNGGRYQQWKFAPGYGVVRDEQTGLCLSESGDALYAEPCDGTAWQAAEVWMVP